MADSFTGNTDDKAPKVTGDSTSGMPSSFGGKSTLAAPEKYSAHEPPPRTFAQKAGTGANNLAELIPFVGGTLQIGEGLTGKRLDGTQLQNGQRVMYTLIGGVSLALDFTGAGEVMEMAKLGEKGLEFFGESASKLAATRGAEDSTVKAMEKVAEFLEKHPQVIEEAQHMAGHQIDHHFKHVLKEQREEIAEKSRHRDHLAALGVTFAGERPELKAHEAGTGGTFAPTDQPQDKEAGMNKMAPGAVVDSTGSDAGKSVDGLRGKKGKKGQVEPNPHDQQKQELKDLRVKHAKGAVRNGVFGAAKGAAWGAIIGGLAGAGAGALKGLASSLRWEAIKAGLRNKHVQRVLIAVVAIVMLVVGPPVAILSYMISSISFQQYGNEPAGIAIPNSEIRPNGYCAEMVTSLDLPGKLGKPAVHITVPDTQGKYSGEQAAANINGRPAISETENYGDPLSFDGISDEDLKYYSNARYPFVAWYWNGTSDGGKTYTKKKKQAPATYYKGKKVIIYSPQTKKGIVTVVAETGPGPSTGIVGQTDVSSSQVDAQHTAWDTQGMRSPRTDDPPGYLGRVVGASPTVTNYLGITTNDPIIFGFAKDQTLKAGTQVTCTYQPPVLTKGEGFKVCIDPGPGGTGAGKTANSLSQSQVAWDVSTALKDTLQKSGYTVTLTKTSASQTLDNAARAKICAQAQSAFTLHIDTETGGNKGYTVYQPATKTASMTDSVIKISSKLANALHDAFSASISDGLTDRKILGDTAAKDDNEVGIFATSGVPTASISLFYLDNKSDASWYTKGGKDKVVSGLLAGISAVKNQSK